MRKIDGIPHLPSVRSQIKKESVASNYGNWLKGYDWSYIVTVRRHWPLTEEACQKMAASLLAYSHHVKTVWLALEKDRGDNMNHLHLIVETDNTRFGRKEMGEALGLKNNPKSLSYFSPVESSDAVAMYCSKSVGRRLQFHDFQSQQTKNI